MAVHSLPCAPLLSRRWAHAAPAPSHACARYACTNACTHALLPAAPPAPHLLPAAAAWLASNPQGGITGGVRCQQAATVWCATVVHDATSAASSLPATHLPPPLPTRPPRAALQRCTRPEAGGRGDRALRGPEAALGSDRLRPSHRLRRCRPRAAAAAQRRPRPATQCPGLPA